MVKTKPPRSAPPSIAKSTGEVFARLALRTRYVDPALAAAWTTIVDKDLAALCRPGRLSGGRQNRTIEVYVRDGAAAARLEFEATRVIDQLNRYFGPGVIGHLHIKQLGRAAASSKKPAETRKSGGLSRFKSL